MQIQIDGRKIEEISDVLFPILNGRQNEIQKLHDFNNAIIDLKQAMAEKGLTEKWKRFVDSLEKARSKISYNALPLLTEFAYRTAFKLQNINHPGNNERYCAILQKIEARAQDADSSRLWLKHLYQATVVVTGFFIAIGGFLLLLNPHLFVEGLLVMSSGVGLTAAGSDSAMDQIKIGQSCKRVHGCLSTVNKTLEDAYAAHIYKDGSRVRMPSEKTDDLSTDSKPAAPALPRTKIQINNMDIRKVDDLLFCILNGREHENEKVVDLDNAIKVLTQVIQENGHADNEQFKSLVRNLTEAKNSKLSPHEFPLLSELAYRVADQIQNHNASPNLEALFTKIEDRAKKLDNSRLLPQSTALRKVLTAAGIVMGALYVMAGIALASHGFLPGIAVVAAGLLMMKAGYDGFKQLSKQTEARVRYKEVNESVSGCLSTLFTQQRQPVQAASAMPTPEGQRKIATARG